MDNNLLTSEDIYQNLNKIISRIDEMIHDNQFQLDPAMVGFGSAREGWGFTLRDIAQTYSKLLKVSQHFNAFFFHFVQEYIRFPFFLM